MRQGAQPIRYEKNGILGYVDLHIEQGRVLEEEGLPVCAVTAISGQTRLRVTLTGRADHAGTTPMSLRRLPHAGIRPASTLAAGHLRNDAGARGRIAGARG